MAHEPLRILLTGPPGCGKTTAVRKIVAALGMAKLAGFYTEEIRTAGARQGSRWQRLDGRSGTLAHAEIKGPHRVGKYGVDVRGFEEQVVPVLDPAAADAKLFVIDEIGKMECFSERFIEAVRRLLASDRSILATVAQKGPGFIREVKEHPAVTLLRLSVSNRDELTRQVVEMLAASK